MCLIKDDLIVNRTSSALDSRMGTEVKVVLKRMSNISLNQGTWQRIVVLISCNRVVVLGEESNVVALGANSYGPLDLIPS